ncbi:DUF3019 domain-containing protein [Pseudoalteromonas denitrificans]|uniref:DUF3019 domain-containing protein n=1 Tax=Pseudoalteromonas denitrificans DSM 6059 TaxID=1123010 RepID=A0A1I1NJG7_9GAMM|nr:DUF3019 domain-containing protein [Pseudoalteromonas denitrificans]SFC97844.1 Protein of unknown function [Pseudoalteromonas denitrificans DSM 6059]
MLNTKLFPLFFILFLVNVNAIADENRFFNKTELTVTPKSCIALHKGQTCYLEVIFSWQAQNNDYCLVNTTRNQILKCWNNTESGQYSFDFQSKESNNFALRLKESNEDLVKSQILVAWVYKSKTRPKSSWRLF